MLRRKVSKRSFHDGRREENAVWHLVKLPEPGESYHFVMDGRYQPCDLIPATARLASPAIISRLTITTLSYNIENIDSLCMGIDQGKIGEVLLVPSCYFSEIEKPLYQQTVAALESRGSRCVPGYVHSKLMLCEMSDGSCYSYEGSGNLRSAKSIEQFVLTNDRALLEFHRSWLETYLNERTTYGRRKRVRKTSKSK